MSVHLDFWRALYGLQLATEGEVTMTEQEREREFGKWWDSKDASPSWPYVSRDHAMRVYLAGRADGIQAERERTKGVLCATCKQKVQSLSRD